MNVTPPHTFNPVGILAGTRRRKAPGGVRATRHPKTMFRYAHTAVKGIARVRPHSLLGSTHGRDRREIQGLLGFGQITRRDGVGVGPQLSISDHVSGRYTRYVGGFGLNEIWQDKADRWLAGYSSVACLDSGVTA